MVEEEKGEGVRNPSAFSKSKDQQKWSESQLVRVFVTLWIVARQVLLSMEFSRPEYRNG